MNTIGTVSARAMGPVLLDYLPCCKFAERALEGTGLPIDSLDDPDVLLPQFAAWRLVNRIALLEQNPCFSYECVTQSRHHPNPLSEREQDSVATDYFRLLCDYVDALNNFAPRTHFWWEIVDDAFLFKRKPVNASEKEGLQVEMYALAAFIAFTRRYVSDQVQITAVFLRAPVSARTIPDDWSRASIYTGCQSTGLAISMRDITRGSEDELHRWMKERFGSPMRVLAPSEEICRFKKIVRSYLADGDAGIDRISWGLGLSTRTLQRKLANWGVSYSAVLAELRMEVATQQLGSSELAIGEIASMLGYRHAGDFTRAFKKFAEMSPSSYRESSHKIVE